MTNFDPSQYGSAVADLVVRAAPNELGPGNPDRTIEGRLRRLSPTHLFIGRRILNDDMARACLAGLWLLHDFLEESHAISQEIHTATGSYWHAIMHRREPDYGNSKYWFRRVGQHPVFGPLLANVQADRDQRFDHSELKTLRAKPSWDPFLFVDVCEQAARANGPLATACRAIAMLEWQLLFDQCFSQAVESTSH